MGASLFFGLLNWGNFFGDFGTPLLKTLPCFFYFIHPFGLFGVGKKRTPLIWPGWGSSPRKRGGFFGTVAGGYGEINFFFFCFHRNIFAKNVFSKGGGGKGGDSPHPFGRDKKHVRAGRGALRKKGDKIGRKSKILVFILTTLRNWKTIIFI